MFTHYPGRTDQLHGVDSTDGFIMFHGDILHPLHVGDVVHMTISINGIGRNQEGTAVNTIWICHKLFEKDGLRFSTKALIPSCPSGCAAQSLIPCLSSSNCVSNVLVKESVISFFDHAKE